MKKNVYIYISVLVLLAGAAGLWVWRKVMSPGDAFAFSILGVWVVWPLCCAVSALFWALSEAREWPYYAIIVIAAVVEPLIVFSNMYDLTVLSFGALGTILSAAVGSAIGKIIASRRAI